MHILPPINCLDEELNLYLKILAPSSFLHIIILWRFCFNFFGIGKETENGVTCRREARSVGKRVHTTFVFRWSRFDKPNNFRYICTSMTGTCYIHIRYIYRYQYLYVLASSTNCSRTFCFGIMKRKFLRF